MMEIPFFSAAQILQMLPMRRAIEVMREAFAALYAGRVTMPPRLGMNTPDGLCLFMPAHIAGENGHALGQKVVNVFPANRASGLPTIHALVTMFDARSGQPIALLEGSVLTSLRTGAVTGLATDLMSNPTARVLTIFGAGGQAAHQIEAVCAARPIREVRMISRGASATNLAEKLQASDPSRTYTAHHNIRAALQGADVIVCSTTSTESLFPADWIAPGTHVNAIGAYTPSMREVGVDLLNRAVVTTDQRAAALHEPGDFLIPIQRGEWSADKLFADLGELVSGAKTVTHRADQITFFKSNGLAVEDIATARAVLMAVRT